MKNLRTCSKFVNISLEFVDFRADFYRNFKKFCRINKIIDFSIPPTLKFDFRIAPMKVKTFSFLIFNLTYV